MSQQADFYILAASDHQARQGFLIKLLGQIQSRNLSVLILLDNEEEVAELDNTLWDYRPDAFLPHHKLGTTPESSIALASSLPQLPSHDVLVNFTNEAKAIEEYPRIVEVIIQEDSVLTCTRKRYQEYRDLGWQLNRHDMRN